MDGNALSPKTVAILRLIADGQSYSQIVDRHPDISYLDIFSAAGEALELGEMVAERDRERRTPPRGRTRAPRMTRPAGGASPSVPSSRPVERGAPVDTKAVLARIKAQYPKAYEPWAPSEDARLASLHRAGTPVSELSRVFQRRPSAIESRLRKLGLE